MKRFKNFFIMFQKIALIFFFQFCQNFPSKWKIQFWSSSSEVLEGRRGWSSTSSLAKDGENGNGLSRAESATTFCSATDLSSVSLKDLREPSPSQQESTRVVTAKPPRPKTYGGSGSDTLNTYRRYSSGDSEGVSPERPQRLQIKGVIEKSNGNSSDNDAEFVIKVTTDFLVLIWNIYTHLIWLTFHVETFSKIFLKNSHFFESFFIIYYIIITQIGQF